MARPSTMFRIAALDGSSGIDIPNPDRTSGKGTIATLVNSGRNANAVVTAQKIGRDQDKSELAWNYLDKETWERMVQFWDRNFFFSFTYYSPVAGAKISRKCYISDRTWQPFDVDSNGIPIAYQNCTANVVDTGEGA